MSMWLVLTPARCLRLEDIQSFSSSSSEYYKYYDNYTSSMTNPVPVHRNDSPVDVLHKQIIKCILCFIQYIYIYVKPATVINSECITMYLLVVL